MCIGNPPMGIEITAPTFRPYPPTLKPKISVNIEGINFWSKIPSKYVPKHVGKIEKLKKSHLKSVLKLNYHFP